MKEIDELEKPCKVFLALVLVLVKCIDIKKVLLPIYLFITSLIKPEATKQQKTVFVRICLCKCCQSKVLLISFVSDCVYWPNLLTKHLKPRYSIGVSTKFKPETGVVS